MTTLATRTRLTLGELLQSTITLTVADQPEDPGSITLKWRRFGDPTTEEVVDIPDPLNPPDPVTRVSEGVYRALIPLDQAGDWRVRWETTDPAQAAVEARILVETIYPGEGES